MFYVYLIIGIVLGLILIVLLLAAMKPDDFRYQRTAVMKAPPEKIFPLINNLSAWNAWSPWEKKDPAMKKTFSGPESGKGCAYHWVGNKDVGEGKLQIIESTPPTRIVTKLEFIKPFTATNEGEFLFNQKGDATEVVWAMYGKNIFMAKIFCLFMNMDKMVGKDFEEGLANLKAIVEK